VFQGLRVLVVRGYGVGDMGGGTHFKAFSVPRWDASFSKRCKLMTSSSFRMMPWHSTQADQNKLREEAAPCQYQHATTPIGC
jgi:hypothetical protein